MLNCGPLAVEYSLFLPFDMGTCGSVAQKVWVGSWPVSLPGSCRQFQAAWSTVAPSAPSCWAEKAQRLLIMWRISRKRCHPSPLPKTTCEARSRREHARSTQPSHEAKRVAWRRWSAPARPTSLVTTWRKSRDRLRRVQEAVCAFYWRERRNVAGCSKAYVRRWGGKVFVVC